MLRRSLSGIRARVLLLVLLATLPAVAVIVASAVEQRRQSAESVRRGTLGLLHLAARGHEEAIRDGRRLLESLTRVEVIRTGPAESCHALLAPILVGNPRYLSIGVGTPDGRILCSAPHTPPGFRPSAPGLAAVREAWERGGFAVSDYTVGALSHRPMLVLARAIPGDEAADERVLFASVSLEWLNAFAADAGLPAGSVLMVTDPHGTVIVHHPEPQKWVGRRYPQTEPIRAISRAVGDTVATFRGPDGTERVYASTSLGDADAHTYGHAAIGVPTDVVYAADRRALQRNLLLLGLVSLFALVLAWAAADLFIADPLRKLLQATRRLRSGDRTARSGLTEASGEIGQLGRGFDEMATALQAREEELEQSTRALRRQAVVFDTVQEGVVITDASGEITGWNRGAEHLFGYSREDALGQPLSFLNDPRLGSQRSRDILAALQVEGRWAGEFPFVRQDGTRGVSEAVVVAQQGEPDGSGSHVMVHRDVTDRKRAEAALRESELSYRLLFNSLTELVYIQDLEGRFINVNDAVIDAYGYSREELLGQTPAFLADRERVDLERVMDCFRRATEGELQRFEFWGVRRNGEAFPKEVVLSKASYFGKDVVIAVARDMTEQKRAEQALRDSEEQLRHAQKMEAVGRLAGGIAHDFNNLLTAIRGNVELILLDLPEDDGLRGDLEQVQKAADTAACLTSQLLTFSRKRDLRAQALQLNTVVQETAGLLQRPLGSGIELVQRLDPDLWPVLAEPGQIEQIVMNLALNARDALPQGGRITIESRNAVLEASDPACPSYVPPGEYVMLSVHDTGPGIDAETQHHIFEPFFTTKGNDKGTGLGLFTVYGIVRGCGGFVWVESEPGSGTTFRVVLPRLAAQPWEGNGKRAAAPLEDGLETVLLVEDEESIRRLTERMLRRMGYQVLQAAGGDEALRLSDGFAGPIHLMLTDLTMPQMDGRELADRMLLRRPGLRVVYMSGYMEEAIRAEDVQGQSARFLQKPFSLEGLARTVREALDTNI